MSELSVIGMRGRKWSKIDTHWVKNGAQQMAKKMFKMEKMELNEATLVGKIAKTKQHLRHTRMSQI